MSSKEYNEKSIHAAVASHENDKLKELLLELKFVLKDDTLLWKKKLSQRSLKYRRLQ